MVASGWGGQCHYRHRVQIFGGYFRQRPLTSIIRNPITRARKTEVLLKRSTIFLSARRYGLQKDRPYFTVYDNTYPTTNGTGNRVGQNTSKSVVVPVNTDIGICHMYCCNFEFLFLEKCYRCFLRLYPIIYIYICVCVCPITVNEANGRWACAIIKRFFN